MTDKYESPLSTRYASDYMLKLFSSDTRYQTWRKLWVSLAKAEKELGLPITDEQISELQAHLTDIDYERFGTPQEIRIKQLLQFIKSVFCFVAFFLGIYISSFINRLCVIYLVRSKHHRLTSGFSGCFRYRNAAAVIFQKVPGALYLLCHLNSTDDRFFLIFILNFLQCYLHYILTNI